MSMLVIGFILGAWAIIGFLALHLAGRDAKDDCGSHILPECLHNAISRIMGGDSMAAWFALLIAAGPFGWMAILWGFGIKPSLKRAGLFSRKV